uniref:Uncharacterized protein n=1 Tax=Oryza sativa subsp. japonica TaxID=39947 RepID=Q8H098_ORYSJ|nr:hypothetical protein LOC_Os10g38010 [Oryza sativa Japonica Group]
MEEEAAASGDHTIKASVVLLFRRQLLAQAALIRCICLVPPIWFEFETSAFMQGTRRTGKENQKAQLDWTRARLLEPRFRKGYTSEICRPDAESNRIASNRRHGGRGSRAESSSEQ